jgi:hypothetical protein
MQKKINYHPEIKPLLQPLNQWKINEAKKMEAGFVIGNAYGAATMVAREDMLVNLGELPRKGVMEQNQIMQAEFPMIIKEGLQRLKAPILVITQVVDNFKKMLAEAQGKSQSTAYRG